MVKGRDKVPFGDSTIEYEIRRSVRRKKTVQISVEGREVLVAAPSKTTKAEIREIVLKRAPWILRHTSTQQMAPQPRQFLGGETLPYLGRDVQLLLEIADVPLPTVSLDHERLRVAYPKGQEGEGRGEKVLEAVVAWYCARAAEHFSEGVDRWWPRLGRGDRPRMFIRSQRRRWGSCAADGTLRFNWRTVMLDPSLLDYVVVHELAHLTFMNHSANFWGLVSQVMPDVKERRRRLRDVGGSLPL